ncbi:expressed unknown protein [Seminavis robusta]|uniref:Peptidase M41 domain-containing protein n=1 Tax=Seminavis robusta TaxID=568900 RepID=A0A9N8ERY5_9STRA|nr:expressed unknown protein [Seminavis robusta]|eukprot:Sro1612_g285970.1 n/a (370) ;mRNA; r:9006-10291
MNFRALLLFLALERSFAFLAPTSQVAARSKVGLNLAAEDEVAALRAAAAKAREDADRLSLELGKKIEARPKATETKVKKLPKEELQARLQEVSFDANGVQAQAATLEGLRQEGSVSLYKSANLRTYPVSLQMLESRTQISLESFGFGDASGEKVSLDDFKYSTLYVVGGASVGGVLALAFLPPNIGATICYLCAIIPILYLAIGSTAPAAIAQVIDSVKNRDDPDRASDSDRVARHEAAHFMCGYMCGLPIVNYNILQEGVPCVEFAASSQRFSNEEVASLSVTAMSGLVAEAMEYGDVRGAENDLLELEQIFRKADDFIGAQQQQDLTRWGALQAFSMLKENKGKLDQVVDAFKSQKDLAECVALLEC